ncbi:SDR family NAD(P)-dependent oxidoreductase [Amnibacterium endophyticum]|uniref:SDR family NAD(P)-dependent oxidoreductase n=1 Tax=Amnibacterium endophyticum TaxID=2109337 RepID=A0ABW4LDE7_9MICO
MAAQRVVLVTGTSSGIGAATRAELAARGWRAFGSSRHADGSDPDVLRLDVTDEASVREAVAGLIARTGRLDALVSNAGVDLTGAIEETSTAEAEALFATNVFGMHRVVREALPHLRAGGGRIVVVGSMGGLVPAPYEGFYAATKHAVEAYTETLRFEVRPHGVTASVVEPGFVRTDLRAARTEARLRLPEYARARRRTARVWDLGVRFGMRPERVARVVADLLEDAHPPVRRRVGLHASALVTLRRVVPPGLFDAGMRLLF